MSHFFWPSTLCSLTSLSLSSKNSLPLYTTAPSAEYCVSSTTKIWHSIFVARARSVPEASPRASKPWNWPKSLALNGFCLCQRPTFQLSKNPGADYHQYEVKGQSHQRQIYPPSMTSSLPVTNLDSSEARYRIP